MTIIQQQMMTKITTQPNNKLNHKYYVNQNIYD